MLLTNVMSRAAPCIVPRSSGLSLRLVWMCATGPGDPSADPCVRDSAEGADAEPQPLLDVKGLSVVTPSGATLAKHVTLRVHAGEDLLVTGPNGSGKSSLVRILRGLWPNVRGSIAVAGGPAGWRSIATVFYVPQQPYLGSSSLLEQLIFPLSLDGAVPGAASRALVQPVHSCRMHAASRQRRILVYSRLLLLPCSGPTFWNVRVD